jgi:hypothetical protein
MSNLLYESNALSSARSAAQYVAPTLENQIKSFSIKHLVYIRKLVDAQIRVAYDDAKEAVKLIDDTAALPIREPYSKPAKEPYNGY